MYTPYITSVTLNSTYICTCTVLFCCTSDIPTSIVFPLPGGPNNSRPLAGDLRPVKQLHNYIIGKKTIVLDDYLRFQSGIKLSYTAQDRIVVASKG